MATKLEALPGPDYQRFIDELLAIAGKPTIEQIREVAARYGISVSKDTAWRFREKGPYARAVERINAGRETREALCAAAGVGTHPLDAMEELMVVALQDHLTEAEDGKIDIKFVVDQLSKLRTSISMRENSRRQQADLERKQKETEAKLSVAEQQMKLRDEQIAKLEREKADWEKKREDAKAALAKAEKKGGVTADTRKLIEDVMAGRVSA